MYPLICVGVWVSTYGYQYLSIYWLVFWGSALLGRWCVSHHLHRLKISQDCLDCFANSQLSMLTWKILNKCRRFGWYFAILCLQRSKINREDDKFLSPFLLLLLLLLCWLFILAPNWSWKVDSTSIQTWVCIVLLYLISNAIKGQVRVPWYLLCSTLGFLGITYP